MKNFTKISIIAMAIMAIGLIAQSQTRDSKAKSGQTIVREQVEAGSFTAHYAQGCLPEGITFTEQAQIDSFQFNYPGCTEIEGDVVIGGMFHNINNLNGLNILTSIGGDLTISYLWYSFDLTGLENISNIGGSLSILNNDSLTSLTGLGNLVSIGGDLNIGDGSRYGNDGGNDVLTNLTGLENLTSIGGCLRIGGNDNMEDASGLNALTNVGGCISILRNSSLTSLSGLENIDTASITDLYISKNYLLSICHVLSICNYLASPNGIVDIIDNAPGCNTPIEVASGCGISLPCLPYGNYYFFSQSDLDNFQTNYPGCTELGGNVNITGNDIVNLNGLNQIITVGGRLLIGECTHEYSFPLCGNPLLSSIDGLINLTQIGGALWFGHNDSLTSLNGLNNLTSIGGSLLIGLTLGGSSKSTASMKTLTSISALSNLTSIPGELYINHTALPSLSGLENIESLGGSLKIYENDLLASLSALSNLHTIRGGIHIEYNDKLVSLSGIDNIVADSITILYLKYNSSLTTCEVESVCDYLGLPVINTWITGNAPGCNSPEEVEAACNEVSIESILLDAGLLLFPNPAIKTVMISGDKVRTIREIVIYNQTGQKVQQSKPVNNILDISKLKPGMYIIELLTDQGKAREKLIVE